MNYIFVWDNFSPDYTGGLAVAVAPNLEVAINQVESVYGVVYEWNDYKKYSLNNNTILAFAVSGGS